MQILSVRGALPEHRYSQDEITDAFADVVAQGGADEQLLRRFHRNAGVGQRHLALPLERVRRARRLHRGQRRVHRARGRARRRAVVDALKAAGLTPTDVDVIVSATVTGLAAPSSRRASPRGSGCAPTSSGCRSSGSAASPARPASRGCTTTCVGHPDEVAVLRRRRALLADRAARRRLDANLVASGLFGDGAAAVVAGRRAARRPARAPPAAHRECAHPQPPLPRHRADHGLGHRRAAGSGSCWTPRCRSVVERYLGEDVAAFLADHGLTRGRHRVVGLPPGRPEGARGDARTASELPTGRPAAHLALARADRQPVLGLGAARAGATPCATGRRAPGSYGLLLAMGPGFCSELVLLRGVTEDVARDDLRVHRSGARSSALERLAELVGLASATPRWSLARGGVEYGRGHYPVMVAAAHRPARRRARRGVAAPAGRSSRRWPGRCSRWCSPSQALRWWCIAHARAAAGTPGSSSCPGLPLVTGGPYRWLRHPNYVAVVVEGSRCRWCTPPGSPPSCSRCQRRAAAPSGSGCEDAALAHGLPRSTRVDA